ncbi:MAG TPA: peptidyl-prolyl cis-trans isomerase [bacterium]|nr:peptidyl-prolyl cis-trans isomerase [bacterium]
MKRICCLVVLAAVAFSCQQADLVARVGNLRISRRAFKAEVENYLRRENLAEATPAKKDSLLARMIEAKLKVYDAYRRAFDRLPAVQAKLQATRDQELYRLVFAREVTQKVVSERELRKLYDQAIKQIHFRHISLPFDRVTEEVDRRRLNEIRGRFFRGRGSFAELVDSLAAVPDSRLVARTEGYLTWGDRDYGDSFYTEISCLPYGRVSTPLLSNSGLHLVQVLAKRNRNLPPFAQYKNRLLAERYRRRRNEMETVFAQLVDRLQKDYRLCFEDETIALLANRSRAFAHERETAADSLYALLSPGDRQRSLLSYRGGSYRIENFLDDLRAIPPNRRPPIGNPEQIRSQLQRRVPFLLLVRYGKDRRLDSTLEYRQTVEPQLERILIREAEQHMVGSRIQPSEDDLRDYYATHLEHFVQPRQMKVTEIAVRTEAEAQGVIESSRYTSFAVLRGQVDTARKGIDGYINEDQYRAIGKTAAQMQVGQVSQPIPNGGLYSVIQVSDIREPVQLSFAEVKPRVAVQLERELRRRYEAEWLQQIRKGVVVQSYPL